MSVIECRQRHLESYLEIRQSLGLRVDSQRRLLADFLDYASQRGSEGSIRADWAVEWACAGPAQHGTSNQAKRLSVVRGYLNYLRAFLPETEVSDTGLLAAERRPKPFLFSPQQLQQLLAEAANLRPRGSLRGHARKVLLGLLASTGLRVGEALRLHWDDVHLEATPPHLVVRKAKFGKSRLVPLHATAVGPLRDYADHRLRVWRDEQNPGNFLVSEDGPLSRPTIMTWLRRVVRRLGIGPTDGGRRPCLHSLRHGFAVARVVAWQATGIDVRSWMPHLSTYLGHVSPAESYWYLTATPELLSGAADAFVRYASQQGGEA
jgi:integrase/recombinase XerD